MLEATLDARVAQPDEATHEEQHLCADAAYAGQPAQQAISQRGLIAHVRSRKQEKSERNLEKMASACIVVGYQDKDPHELPTAEEIVNTDGPQAKPRRWVVERSHSWINRFRKLMVRYEKSAASFETLLSLAAALIYW